MRILVTGGAGFIGSHVCERLLGQGEVVTVVDDLNDFYSPSLKLSNLARLVRFRNYSFYKLDITDETGVRNVALQVMPDVIIHLAARAGVRPSLEQPFLYASVNVHGTLSILEAARQAAVKKVVFASSSSVYGLANQVPFREDDYTMMPVSPYAATKIAGEKLCYTYSHLYGISAICLRFFTVYGPRQRPDLAIRKFTEKIERGVPVQVFGNGETGRDYTYIDDLVDGVLAALRYECQYEIINLGNSRPITLNNMIETLETALGKQAVRTYMVDQPGDVPITYADIGKAQHLLGYKLRISFSEGIGRFVTWYRDQQNSAEPEILQEIS